MKLTFLALVTLSATALAQNATPGSPADFRQNPPISQVGCPVSFTTVALETKARLMPVQVGQPQDGSLSFEYRNQSGKKIQSIAVRVELLMKKSVYDLDATPIALNMMLAGNGAVETLPLAIRAYGLTRVNLQQVTYSDGTIWTAGDKLHCGYAPQGTENIGKLQ
ncbi:hypothetical protein [Acidobacterium sp. S8]|uniref:hypothetical protein n=1 Tax=Acidobacterium sp. S8 TaxID=1641854 RepID=UPI00131EA7C2|nr:hypothetical protein [Acidobacterium sp. S8]